jgi:hypothetical protein
MFQFDILVSRIKGQLWTFFTIDWFLQCVLLGGDISPVILPSFNYITWHSWTEGRVDTLLR